jgi:hypothetical protein
MPGCRRALSWLGSQLLYRRCQADCPEPMRTSQRNLHHQLLRSGVLIFLNRAMAPCAGASTIAAIGVSSAAHVRFGSGADITGPPNHVRFASQSGHARSHVDTSASCQSRPGAPQQKYLYSIRSSASASSLLSSRVRSPRCSRLPWNTDYGARVVGVALFQPREVIMHSKFVAITSALVVMLASIAAWAQSSTSERTPGHIMQRTPQAKSTGPGASEYAPGHLKRKYRSESASKFTPSHRTTPSTTGIRTR